MIIIMYPTQAPDENTTFHPKQELKARFHASTRIRIDSINYTHPPPPPPLKREGKKKVEHALSPNAEKQRKK